MFMTTLPVGHGGEVLLPDQVRERYGLGPNASLRLVETRSGILLVPQSTVPMSAELAQELEEWQTLGAEAWGQFSYDEAS
jgi:bifunctional DNA-binding transcriptional regulator/antitoxin component of YhaV-PrlF toxin-antitoxin module